MSFEGRDECVEDGHTIEQPSGALTLESGLEALEASPAFTGTVEPIGGLDALETCEHLALFYRTNAERFRTVTPFVQQGLERGERVLFVLEAGEADRVCDRLRGGSVDVDAARERGQLLFPTVEQTYFRTGRFDVSDMLSIYRDAVEDAHGRYPGLRLTANANFIFDERTDMDAFMRYESRVNDLFADEDCIALCQYDLERVPPKRLIDVIRTHPHLVYEDTVCHNFYYTPPAEFLRDDEPLEDVERMLNTLVDRAQARADRSQALADLEESNERLKRFAYVASHDLQEPLRMISTFLQLLESRHGDDLDEEAGEYIEFAVDGADRMREMVDGLLSYSRIDMAEPDFEPVDTAAIVEDVRRDLTVTIDDTGAHLTVERLPRVVGDANQLQQLFTNLCSNAIKYNGDGEPSIEIGADVRGDRCLFTVSDTGIGIDPEYVDHVFEIFNRLHSTDEFDGTGIGLALCRKIVTHHGGDIWIESEPDVGTTVSFTLPAAR